MAFHDHWPSGQLLSRAISDLTTIRRFLAYAGIFLVVNVATVLVGLGIRVLKFFGHGRRTTRRFLAQARELRHTELTKVALLATLSALIITLPELTLAAMLAINGYAVAAGSLSLGTVVGAITIATYLRWPLESLSWLLAETTNAAAASTRYWEVRDTVPAVADPAEPRGLARPVRGALRLEGVRFQYPGAATEVLRGVNLDVRPGETVALVVAHRPSTVALADRVALLADGQIAAVGTHAELLAEVPEYRRLLSSLDASRLPR